VSVLAPYNGALVDGTTCAKAGTAAELVVTRRKKKSRAHAVMQTSERRELIALGLVSVIMKPFFITTSLRVFT
jgi:hypothetical protein